MAQPKPITRRQGNDRATMTEGDMINASRRYGEAHGNGPRYAVAGG